MHKLSAQAVAQGQCLAVGLSSANRGLILVQRQAMIQYKPKKLGPRSSTLLVVARRCFSPLQVSSRAASCRQQVVAACLLHAQLQTLQGCWSGTERHCMATRARSKQKNNHWRACADERTMGHSMPGPRTQHGLLQAVVSTLQLPTPLPQNIIGRTSAKVCHPGPLSQPMHIHVLGERPQGWRSEARCAAWWVHCCKPGMQAWLPVQA